MQLASSLLFLYLGWGAVYFAIAVAVRTIPPLSATAIQFVGAGLVVLGWSVRPWRPSAGSPSHHDLKRPRAWAGAFLVGGTLLAGGNAGFFWGEQYVASGIAALLGATISIWVALIGRVFLGERLSVGAALGVGAGVVAVGLLVTSASWSHAALLGMLAMLASAISWSVGMLLLRQFSHLWTDAVVGMGMQMMAAAVLLIVAAAGAGELRAARWRAPSWETILGELAVIGLSAAGFLVLHWLVNTTSMVLSSSFAFVNPVVAVAIGWVIGGEAIPSRAIFAGVLVIAGVALIVAQEQKREWNEPVTVPTRQVPRR